MVIIIVRILDGFYIGQATFGNPWIFTGEKPALFKDRLPVIVNHAQYLIEHKGEFVGTREIRKHLLAYVKGLHSVKPYKKYLSAVDSFEQIKTLLYEISEMEMDYVKRNLVIQAA